MNQSVLILAFAVGLPIPAWASYAVAGIFAVLAVLVGVMMQRPRRPEDYATASQVPEEKPTSVEWIRRCDSWGAD